MHISQFLKKIIVVVFSFAIVSCETTRQSAKDTEIKAPDELINAPDFPGKDKIALMAPITGPSKDIGISMLNAAIMANFDDKNNNISIEVIDTNSLEFSAKESVAKLKKNNVQLILGPLFYGESVQVVNQAKKYDIPVLSFSNNADLAGKGALVLGITPEIEAQTIINYACSKDNATNFYAILPEGKYGNIVAKSITNAIMHKAGSSFSAHYYSNSDELKSCFNEIMSKINSSTETNNSLIFPNGGKDLLEFSQLLADIDSKTRNFNLYGFEKWDNETIISDRNLNGAVFIKTKTDQYHKYENEFRDLFGYKPPYISVLAHDALLLASKLEKNKAGYNMSTILENNMNFGYGPSYKIGSNGIASYALPLAMIDNGSAKIIPFSQ